MLNCVYLADRWYHLTAWARRSDTNCKTNCLFVQEGCLKDCALIRCFSSAKLPLIYMLLHTDFPKLWDHTVNLFLTHTDTQQAPCTWWCRRPWVPLQLRGSRSGWRPWSALVPLCPKSAAWSSGRWPQLSLYQIPRQSYGGSPPWLRKWRSVIVVILCSVFTHLFHCCMHFCDHLSLFQSNCFNDNFFSNQHLKRVHLAWRNLYLSFSFFSFIQVELVPNFVSQFVSSRCSKSQFSVITLGCLQYQKAANFSEKLTLKTLSKSPLCVCVCAGCDGGMWMRNTASGLLIVALNKTELNGNGRLQLTHTQKKSFSLLSSHLTSMPLTSAGV